ncbi:MAG: ribonuclease HII [Candidatus Staskawiczbacteria bacterium]|jgi:ribonuclease HII
MKIPNLNEEKKLWKKGFKYVVGLDEVGRGPLAGPVVAVAVMLRNFQFSISNFQSISKNPIFKKINDSKKMTEKDREEVYNALIKNTDIKWGIGVVSEKVIDKINILEATKLAMKKAVFALSPKIDDRQFLGKNVFLLLDGNFGVDFNEVASAKGFGGPKQKPIIKGDEKVISIAMASIIAKVTRDRMMQKFHKKYPKYGFDKNKGYGTAFHIEMIEKHGPCKIHRKSFYPVSKF